MQEYRRYEQGDEDVAAIRALFKQADTDTHARRLANQRIRDELAIMKANRAPPTDKFNAEERRGCGIRCYKFAYDGKFGSMFDPVSP